MEAMTPEEYSKISGYSERHVRRLIASGKIQAVERFGAGGVKGLRYEIPLTGCDPAIIKKYNRMHGIKPPAQETPPKPKSLPENTEELTDAERQEVAFWKRTLEEWQEYRNCREGRKDEMDEQFIRHLKEVYPDRQFSVRMLYRKRKAFMNYGDCALADGRGKHKNHKKAVPDEVFSIFQYYYLDEQRLTVRRCIKLTELQLKHIGLTELLPLASEKAFAREIDRSIPLPILKYFRYGDKAFKDECAPYIHRIYGDLDSNDIWVCDNHTFDIFINDGEHKKPIRVYLTAFMDVCSRKMMGWYVTDAPCSDATLYALRRGIERYGIPKRILADNGREFLTHDIGGRGFRKNGRQNEHQPPTILDNLGIEFRTALVRNARAKIVERAFREVKECFSRLFEGYTGGTIAERPERLKTLGKKASNFTPYADFADYVDTYLEGWFNYQEHGGVGMGHKTRNEVYAAKLVEVRTAKEDELNLMMLRNSRMQTVQRDGVRLKIYDTEIYFWSHELTFNHLKEKVYYRYDPADLSEVRVYDENDRFICTAQQQTSLSYFADKEEVAEKMRQQREFTKFVASYKKKMGIEAEDALALVLEEAERNLAKGEKLDPKVIIPIRKLDEEAGERELDKAVGADEPLDWTAALKRIEDAKRAEGTWKEN